MKKFKLNLVLVCSLLFAISSCKKETSITESGAVSKTNLRSKITLDPLTDAEPCMQRSLVAGQHTLVGTVDVSVGKLGDLILTYHITKANVYLLEVHADVFKSLDEFKADKKISGGGAVPGKFTYSNTFTSASKTTSYTVVIPKEYVVQNSINGVINIATHASLSTGDTAWAGITKSSSQGVSLENAHQFPGANWSVYFDFDLNRCSDVDFTFAWEDLQNQGNDGDYNDLVIQANNYRRNDVLKLTFKIAARGAYNDHQLKIRLPKTGITAILGTDGGQSSYTTDGNDYVITIFGSTKFAMSNNGLNWDFANSYNEQPCTPYAVKEITLMVDDNFQYNTSKPYQPFISVYPSGAAPFGGGNYDLYIYELSNRDQWTSPEGDVYPNGIVIPRTWRWPLETIKITRPYPLFPANNWAGTLADESLTYDPNRCL